MEEIIKRIRDKISNQIDDINCGGCIHFAYFLSKELHRIGVNHSIVILDRNEIVGKYKNHYTKIANYGCSHVFINVYGIGTVDGSGLFTFDYMCSKYPNSNVKVYNEYTHKNLNYLRRKPSAWNTCYDRKQNRLLSKIIKDAFSDYRGI